MSKNSSIYRNNPINIDFREKIQYFFEIQLLIKEGKEKLSACSQIIKKYNIDISSRALYMQFHRFESNGNKIDKRCLLDATGELLLVSILEAFSLINMPLTREVFLTYVAQLMGYNQTWDGSSFYKNFLKRHKNIINTKTLQSLSGKRFQPTLEKEVDELADNFNSLVKKYQISDDFIINCDETRVNLNPRNMKIKGIESKIKRSNTYIEPKRSFGATYLPFVNRNRIIMQVVILPYKKFSSKHIPLTKSQYYVRRNSTITYYTTTTTGYVDKSCWDRIIHKFLEVIRNVEKKENILLLLDNLGIHNSLESITNCINNKVHLLYLPKYTTHFMQPCDQYIFLNFKKSLRNKYRRKLIMSDKDKDICLELIENIENINNIITKEIIESSWEKIGLIPFSKDVMITRAKEFIGNVKSTNIFEEIRNVFVNIINDALDITPNDDFPCISEISELLLPHEFVEKMKEFKQELINKNKKKSNKKRKLQSEEAEALKKQKTSTSGNIQCCFGLHDKIKSPKINVNTKWQSCSHCLGFKVCDSCDSYCPEYLYMHEESCEKLIKLTSKN